MKKVNVKLNQNYKQFKNGFDCELQGDLIIVSGVNGSGKSQLIDILNKSQVIEEGTSNMDLKKLHINSEIKIDNKTINRVSISRRSFKDNISINNIVIPNPKNSHWHKEEAWKAFSNYNDWDKHTNEYSKSKSIIEENLKEKGLSYTPEWNSRMTNNTDTHISEEEFKKSLPDDFVWEKDDLFSNRIDELFYEFAVKRNSEQVKLSMGSGGFNNDEYIKNAPWTILNQLFKTLKFDYRFKKDYVFEMPNFKEKIMIYPILSDGNLDLNSPRELSDLSDGEKTIISLTFALLNENRRPIEKILLLDEFDNTLNPSLVESLFKVLEEYFVNKGVMVIMTTHSPVTISLAPEYATYYEMFKQDNNSPKIISVDRYQYTELMIANKSFYEKIQDQTERIKELEENIESQNSDKIVFVEDKYTQIYKLAWLKLNDLYSRIENLESDFEKNSPFRIFSKSNKDSLKGFLANSFMDEWNNKKIVGLFDFDDAYECFRDLLKKAKSDKQLRWSEKRGTENTGLYSKREQYSNISALMLPVPEYRAGIANEENTTNRLEVELLFTDESIKEMYGDKEYKTEKIIDTIVIPKIGNKEHFWKKAVNLPKEKFSGFIPLFQRIEELLELK